MNNKPFKILLTAIDELLFTTYSDVVYQSHLELLFENGIYNDKYINLFDFMEFHTPNLDYDITKSLATQYADIAEAERSEILELMYNLIYHSNFHVLQKTKIASFYNRYNIAFSKNDDYYKIIPIDSQICKEGSYGKVYILDGPLVKKQLKNEYWTDKDIVSRFKNEFRIQEKLFNSGVKVLNVFDFDPVTNSFLMEKADSDLYDLMDSTKYDLSEKINLINQLLETFEKAHSLEIIHRDLHPANIMFISNNLFVSDFGFAKDSTHLRSRFSSISPKPNHSFVAPEGFNDFTTLDKQSDVYSVGKIIDFIMGDSDFSKQHPFKLLVERCTKNIKAERTISISNLKVEFDDLCRIIISGNNISEIKNYIDLGKYSIAVEDYLLKLSNSDDIAHQIIANRWYKLPFILIECSVDSQMKILNSVNRNYANATGHNGWTNYDIFSEIAYTMVMSSNISEIITIAYNILEECAQIRYRADDLLKKIPIEKKQLLINQI